MKSQLVNEVRGQRTFVVVLNPGEEAFGGLNAFAVDHQIAGASLTAIGAFERATVGWFDLKAKTYRKIPIDEQCEVLSVIGDTHGTVFAVEAQPFVGFCVVEFVRDLHLLGLVKTGC